MTVLSKNMTEWTSVNRTWEVSTAKCWEREKILKRRHGYTTQGKENFHLAIVGIVKASDRRATMSRTIGPVGEWCESVDEAESGDSPDTALSHSTPHTRLQYTHTQMQHTQNSTSTLIFSLHTRIFCPYSLISHHTHPNTLKLLSAFIVDDMWLELVGYVRRSINVVAILDRQS